MLHPQPYRDLSMPDLLLPAFAVTSDTCLLPVATVLGVSGRSCPSLAEPTRHARAESQSAAGIERARSSTMWGVWLVDTAARNPVAASPAAIPRGSRPLKPLVLTGA